ncbi:MAG: GAF domain-containing sensor histidine kinase [Chloroflexi bacterium]|nr:MAG: GAF domain-containing sensor histidine kinase [Chloroflexota bacterium]
MGSTPGGMSARLGQTLAWGSLALSVGLLAAALYLSSIMPATVPASRRPASENFTFMLLAIAFSTLGAFLALRRETNRVAWMACAIGLGISLSGFGLYYQLVAEYSRPGQFPAATLAFLAGDLGWSLALGVMLTFLPLLFPDGRLISARWKPVLWLSGSGIALAVVGSWLSDLEPGLKTAGDVLQNASGLVLLLAVIAALASLVVRYRRSGSQQRLQLKWFIAAITLVGLLAAVQSVMAVLETQLPLNDLIVSLVLLAIPASIAIAVFKYRLYEIDLVINRALVYGGLAAFITIVYVGVVVGIGTLVRSRGQFNLALSILATALVAVAFQPVRQRVERWANQVVYGSRSTPYEALTGFSHRIAGAYADEEVLSRLARVLVEGTGATMATVWIYRASDPIAAASWPEGEPPLRAEVADRVVQVRHEGELLGVLTLKKGAGEPFTPVEESLLTDLAAQAGQVLRNIRLTAELQARLQEISSQAGALRESRQRIVAAQDAERRRLERNIHDGAQQHLVALAVKLRLAATLAKRDPEKARRSIIELKAQTAEALQTLRDLAQGIYPPGLHERGLLDALSAHAAVTADGVGRYDPDVEAAVYFCCLEALQNAAKHAHASRTTIHLEQREGHLRFAVTDNGIGFDPERAVTGAGVQNMKDRLASLGGTLTVQSRPGEGTIVTGVVPVRERSVVGAAG